ncbi:hypothetical protein Y032_0411g955 [Ancylostoma ceylanicum]|uniref:Uncharacterized protein n=1 Tax=Ancylostoma ceylanicum TaxID=53326 RepID=A0A016X266_9BILA|nr:hypothetical protein Y032_0411g955 [Ancylostoma ceylanicum]
MAVSIAAIVDNRWSPPLPPSFDGTIQVHWPQNLQKKFLAETLLRGYFRKKAKVACKMMLIFVISTSNNSLVRNSSEFHEVPYLWLLYSNRTKMGLWCKMNTIFVFSTSNNLLCKVSAKEIF